ncbi:MAG TPA: hypothetical protein VM073_12055 [Usitatibacter sp.]|nr:hypothetical protein [Usitatibacter sp.]
MFVTIVLLIGCALEATAGVPLMLKLIPPNPYYGYPARSIKSKPDHWVDVNVFAGRALVGAAAFSALAIMVYNGTWLRSGWAQLFVFVIPLAAAIGATVWYERTGGLK